MKIKIFEPEYIDPIKPLKYFGITDSIFDINLETLIFTWIAMAILFAITLFINKRFKKKGESLSMFVAEKFTEFFMDLCKESFGFFKYNYFAFISSLFLFTLFCNLSGMLPFTKEPTSDINTALACGVCSFMYVQYQKIKIHGLWEYLKEYMKPIFILLPLNIIGETAKAISMSFRLFGNILGGSIIVLIALKAIDPFRVHFMIYTIITLPICLIIKKKLKFKKMTALKNLIASNIFLIFSVAWLLLFFTIFEGVIQAFVITMLTITYLSLIEDPGSKEQELEKAI